MKVIRNCALAVKLVFQYAPWNALLEILGFFIPSIFSGMQIILVQKLVDSGLAYVSTGGQIESVAAAGISLVAMLFFWVVIERLGVYENMVIETKLTERMAPDIMEKLDRLAYQSFESREIQETLQRVCEQPWQTINACFNNVVNAIWTVVSILFMLGVYMAISVWIGIGLLLIAVPMVAMMTSATRRMHQIWRDTTEEKRRMKDLKLLLQNRHSMYEMKVFGSQALIAEKWKDASGKVEAETKKAGGKAIALEGASGLLSVVYFVFIIVTLSYSLVHGAITLGQFVAAISSVGSMTGKVNHASERVSNAIRSGLDINFYREFLAAPQREEGRNVEDLNHCDIAFENVSFSYPGTDRKVLSHVTFRIKEGERVAFVGENGAGKSTIIKLLCGLYEPDAGRVMIGGVNVRDLSEERRRKLLSVVFQDFQGYELTLRENVAMGDIAGLEEDGRIREALKLAGGEELFLSEEKGLERNLGHLEEDGKDLSKGQWQRVAIARAFMARAAFCVLDEPTASLDPVAESHMYENFARIFHASGTIMISHRLASAKMADRIMVLDGGRIVQNGNHEQLMGEDGLYRTMYLAQSSWYAGNDAEGGMA